MTHKEFRKGYTREIKRHIIDDYMIYTIANNIDDVIKSLNKIKEVHKEYSKITIEIDSYNDYGDRVISVSLIGFKLETYEELDIRIQKDIDQQAVWDKADLDNYEALRKKLGK